MSLKGNPRNLREFGSRLRTLTTTAAAKITTAAAPALSAELQRAFDAGETAYGDGRPAGKHGPVSLRRTGRLRSFLAFGAVGRRIRVVLSLQYAKYMVGRFRILPIGSSAMPPRWNEILGETTKSVLDEVTS